MARVVKAPNYPNFRPGEIGIFLAGSIDMGAADDWQSELIADLKDLPKAVLLNPRRDNWDPTWKQSIDNPQFREQVEWELDWLDRSMITAMYFAPGSQSPITLLELGLRAQRSGLIVCCPEGFWRKGNVDVVCARYGVGLVSNLSQLAEHVRVFHEIYRRKD